MANILPNRFAGVNRCKECGAERKCCRNCHRCQRHCRCDQYEPPLIKELTLNVWAYSPEVVKVPGKQDEYRLIFEDSKKKLKVVIEGLMDFDLEEIAEVILKTEAARKLRLNVTEETLHSISRKYLQELLQSVPEGQLREIIKVAQESLD